MRKIAYRMSSQKKAKDKPDNVVDAPGLMRYTTNLGAPAVQIKSTQPWRNRGVNKVNNRLAQRAQEIRQMAQEMADEFYWNQTLYAAQYSFEPVVGEDYYLYSRHDHSIFLSPIAPDQWDQVFIGAFYLDSDSFWRVAISHPAPIPPYYSE